MGKRNPYIYPFPYPFWLRTVYRRHIHSCLFFFFFILGPNDGDFIGRGSRKKKKKQEAKSNERKTGNLHLGCKAHFAKCRQRLFILYTLHISTAPKEQIPCLSSCWLFVSISSHLYYFFFFLATLWHLVRTQTDTLVLLHGRHVALLFFSYLISICAVLLLWYPKRRRSDSQRWRRVQCVTLATVLKYNKQQESI